jgi:quinol monooxygenase YgiN
MAGFGMLGRIVTHPGRREELVEVLLDAAKRLGEVDGCELYVVSRDAADPDTLWVVEAWRDEAAHDASLTLPEVRATIERGRPLIAAFDAAAKLEPVGGLGLG